MTTSTERPRSRSRSPVRLRSIAVKELREILRDRRTTMTLILMPLLVYPLLGVTFQKFLIGSLRKSSVAEYQIGVVNEIDGMMLLRQLEQGGRLLEAESPSDDAEPISESPDLESLLPGKPATDVKLSVFQPFESTGTRKELIDLVAEHRLDAAVFFESHSDDDQPRAKMELLFDPQSFRGRDSRDRIVARLQAIKDAWIETTLIRNEGMPSPPRFVDRRIDSTVETFSIVTFIPLMLVLMTITGAVYPAIDLTAGERERGTMEILIAAPVSRLTILVGKFFAVLTVAMLTAIVNLTGMLATVYTLGLDRMVFGDGGITFAVIFQIMLLLLVFAGFFSALMLGLTSFARSFKEAQAYLIPLMLVALAPGLLSLMPDLELNATLAILPLVNIVLAGRDLLVGNLAASMFAITLISTCIYGLLALTMAARVFGTDSILYGSEGSWADLFRRPAEPAAAPSMSSAMLCLAVLFPCFIVIGGLSSRFGDSVSEKLLANAGVTILLFAVLPGVFARLSHSQIQSTFFLFRPRLLSVIGAILLGCSMWTAAYELEILTLSEERVEILKQLFESMKVDFGNVPLPIKIFALALVPAVCEEFFFRGYLFSAFLRNKRPFAAIVGSACLFGLFHVIVRDALLYERFLPSTLMGLVLGYVCYRSGSLIPGILLHALHNGLLVSMSHFEKQLVQLGIGTEDRSHLPTPWLAGGFFFIAAGLAIIYWAGRASRDRKADPSDSEAEEGPVSAIADSSYRDGSE